MVEPTVVPLHLASLLLIAAAPASPPSTDAASVDAVRQPRLRRGSLRLEGIDRAGFEEALALRVPDLRLEPRASTTTVDPSEPMAFIDLRPGPPTSQGSRRFSLTIVVSDGRAFDRDIDVAADEADSTRLLASTVANLLLAIEAGTVQADRADVPLPSLEPECPACTCPSPPACPVSSSPVEPAPEPEPGPESSPTQGLELAPVASLATVLGLGQPAQADRYAAFGGAVGMHARLPQALFFGTELRVVGRGEPTGTRLVRLRVALGGGIRLRRGPVSLGASVWGTVEPWWLRGAPIDPPPRPLWGLVARLSPALYESRLGGRDLALTVGPTFELAASASFDEGPQVGLVVIREQGQERSRLRVGGLELSTGFAATLWLGVPRRSR
ncbi:MAG: hypothetical protein AB1Z98_35435 [Nannocystaceae bacterium]